MTFLLFFGGFRDSKTKILLQKIFFSKILYHNQLQSTPSYLGQTYHFWMIFDGGGCITPPPVLTWNTPDPIPCRVKVQAKAKLTGCKITVPPNCLNIISIFQIGALGNPVIKTPHLDQLASRSTVFSNAFTSGNRHFTLIKIPTKALQFYSMSENLY